MLFNSITFLIFLPIVFVLYWFIFNCSIWWQNLFVVVVSYIFYGWWDWKFLILIALTSFCSWLSGIWMGEQDRESCPVTGLRGHRQFVMVANIVLNLGILGFFKYYNFFVDSFIHAFEFTGLNLHPQTLKIILPVGISFYTFQALSYSIDVYRGNIRPTRDIVAFFAYVSFFPQLVAGPIERATNLLPQFLSSRTFSYPHAVDGCRQILWGLFKKMVVADNCAKLANMIYEGRVTRADSGIALWIAAICFAFQIYGDFSGYSDIAIGCSRLFGIKLMRNFNYPYFSRDIAEFWRRWHISLSTWFRDYLYIPLGGSKCKKSKMIRNTFLIFLISGLWHGANWTFVVWGGIHALCFLPLVLLGANRSHLQVVACDKIFPSVKESIQIASTFLITTLAWVFFRSASVADAIVTISGMFRMRGGLNPSGTGIGGFFGVLPWIGMLLGLEWINRREMHGLCLLPKLSTLRYLIYFTMLLIILVFQGQSQSFIYFQF